MASLVDILLTIVLFPINLIRYIGKGFSVVNSHLGTFSIWSCVKVYHFFRYALKGISLPFVALGIGFRNLYNNLSGYQEEVRHQKIEESQARALEKAKKQQEKQAALEEKVAQEQAQDELVIENDIIPSEEEANETSVEQNMDNENYDENYSDNDLTAEEPQYEVNQETEGNIFNSESTFEMPTSENVTSVENPYPGSVDFSNSTVSQENGYAGNNPFASEASVFAQTDSNGTFNPMEGGQVGTESIASSMAGTVLAIPNQDLTFVMPGEEQATEEQITEEQPKPAEEQRVRTDDFYINEDVEIEKKGLGDYINDFLELIIKYPSEAIKKLKDSLAKAGLAKDAKNNEKDINRQALILDLENGDADKAEKKVMWEYVVRTPEGKTVKGYFAAFSRLEVHSFLMSEGNTIYSIRTNKWIQTMYSSVNGNGCKMKKKDMIFFLTQLSTYIKAGIPLVDAMSILTRQFKQKNYQRMFRTMMYDLTMGYSFSKTLENEGDSFPPILINMVKASELTGELPEALDDMAEYFTQTENSRKEMVSAMTYPAIVFVMCIAVGTFMMVYIVPQFVEIYASMDASAVPKFTLIVMNVSDFLKKNLIFIFIWMFVIIFLVIYSYRNIKVIRKLIQWTLMHIPVVKNVIIYGEVMTFAKTFSSLLSHNVFITDSMNILRKLTNNEIYKIMIMETVNNLASGEKVSTAFKDHWAFPVPAYEMIVTGERTGQLAEMMAKVADFYQEEHKTMVASLKSFVEPIIIVFLTAIVGVIVLAIVVPMFSMYQAVNTVG